MTDAHPLLTKIERSLVLTEAERVAIMLLPLRQETVRADQAILREGSRPRRSCLVVEGVCCKSKVGPNGKRHILALHIPEDMPDLTSLHLDRRDSDMWALTDCALAFMQHDDLNRLCEENPRLARFLWRTTLVEGAMHREWTMNVGLREGPSRMAHLFCEMMLRMQAIGRADKGSCALPLTQEDLAEATGMSSVHANRVLQDLRQRKLVAFARGQLTIHDWDGLVQLGDFRPDYLHILAAKAP